MMTPSNWLDWWAKPAARRQRHHANVSVNSPMGEALMKAHVGDTVKVKAPRGVNEFKILEIVS
jgi:transcription elongation GreA/GreB family factor